MDEYNYEDDYKKALKEVEQAENRHSAAVQEIRRLRAVACDYSSFYNLVKEAFDKKEWELIEKHLKEFE